MLCGRLLFSFLEQWGYVWYEFEPGNERLVQGTGPDRRQLAWRDVIRSFAEEVDYRQGAAVRWCPLPHIELNRGFSLASPSFL